MHCHTVAIIDAGHGSIQQPAHNTVTAQLAIHRAIFYTISSECDTTAHDIITACIHWGKGSI